MKTNCCQEYCFGKNTPLGKQFFKDIVRLHFFKTFFLHSYVTCRDIPSIYLKWTENIKKDITCICVRCICIFSTGRAPQKALHHFLLHIGPTYRSLYHFVLFTIGASKKELLRTWRPQVDLDMQKAYKRCLLKCVSGM